MVDQQESAAEPVAIRIVRNKVTVIGGIVIAVLTAFGLAGVVWMPLAFVVLIFGVWVFPVVEIWYSKWILKTGTFRNCVLLLGTLVMGLASLSVAVLLEYLKAQDISAPGVAQHVPSAPSVAPSSPTETHRTIDSVTATVNPRPDTVTAVVTKGGASKAAGKPSQAGLAQSPNTGAAPSSTATPKAPNLTLRFVGPEHPALIIVNPSDGVARSIKWGVVLWNLDQPERINPLPIPFAAFDWLKAHEESGAQGLFDSPSVARLLKAGDRLMGSAMVDCPDCERGRTYIVYIEWGKGGWFYELENEKSGKVLVPNAVSSEGRATLFDGLRAAAPPSKRVPITQQ